MGLARFTLSFSALAFGLVGLCFLVSPTSMMSQIDISLDTATADSDIRAIYGGLELGLAVFFVMGLSRRSWTRPALVASLLVFSGMSGARVLSFLIAGFPDTTAYLLLAVEVLGVLLSGVALNHLPRTDEATP